MSEVIDLAPNRLIRAERRRRAVAAYARQPLTDDEHVIADPPVVMDLGDDDVDYDALVEPALVAVQQACKALRRRPAETPTEAHISSGLLEDQRRAMMGQPAARAADRSWRSGLTATG